MARGRRRTAAIFGSACLGLAAALLAVPGRPLDAREPENLEIVLVPVGAVDPERIEQARQGISRAYDVRVSVRKEISLPQSAYYAPRSRYRAEKLAEHLGAFSDGHEKVLGLAKVDVSTTKGKHADWGVIGLAFLGGTGGVVSDFRIRGKGSSDLQKSRWQKTIIHEVGHMLGLDHCTASKTCPMQEYEGSIKNTDRSGYTLCESCREQVIRG